MISAIAEGASRIANYSTGADCHSTLGCVRALGIEVEGAGAEFVIHGKGLDGLRPPAAALDAGNSGSTIRMLSGILAAQPFHTCTWFLVPPGAHPVPGWIIRTSL